MTLEDYGRSFHWKSICSLTGSSNEIMNDRLAVGDIGPAILRWVLTIIVMTRQRLFFCLGIY